MDLGNGLGHLTYSTLVHPGDTWAEMWDSLNRYVPQVKARVSPNKSFGVSLRLSASSAQTLTGDPGERERLKEFLHQHDMYLYTVNAFPYGPFKNRIVKKDVYEPDWSTNERAIYTMQVADILAEVARAAREPVDPEPAARLQAEGHGPRVRQRVHAPRHQHRRAHGAAREAHGPYRHARVSSPSPRASSRPPRKPSTTSRTTCTRAKPCA